MRFNRRHFLVGIGFGLLSLLGLDKLLKAQTSSSNAQLPTTSPARGLSGEQPLLRFVAIADSGSGDRNQYAVAAAMSHYHQQKPFSLVVLAGDNIYTNGETWKIQSVFEKPYAALLKQGVKFRACLGNHDIRTENGDPQVHYANFHMQGRYYSFREQDVQFFVLDTNHNADWQAQLSWLEQTLQRSDARVKVAFGHHPIYSSGRYGSDRAMIQALTPLFKQHQVQLYINGHEHDYERTRPIDGTTYLITGIGGASLRPVSQSEWTEFSTSRYGFSAIEVYHDRLEIQGIGIEGQIFDHGVILL